MDWNPQIDTITSPSFAKDTRTAPDDELIQRLLMGVCRVSLFWDIHERFAQMRVPLPLGAKRRQRIDMIRQNGALFIHVPKNAGTSISGVLYGQSMRHETIRYYQHVAPDLNLPSFALWRDPVSRFVSAYRFARNGGSGTVKVASVFNETYRKFRSLDDAIDHVAERIHTPFRLDHVFRPQWWYVTGHDRQVAVDRLIDMRDIARIPETIHALRGVEIPCLNRTGSSRVSVTPAQADRIRTLYAADMDLAERVERFS